MRSSSIIRAAIFILSFSLSILLGMTAIHATAADPFYWEKMDVDLQLVESGDLLVTETQKYVFTDRYTNRRNRYIQIDKIDSIQDIVVTENNQPVSNLQISKSDGNQHISWDHTLTEKFPQEHTFVLKYRAIGSLEVKDPQTKFKWMAIFPDRKVPVNTAQVTLHLPSKLAGVAGFTTNGVAVDIKKIDPSTIQFVAKGSIEPQSKLAILGQFSTNSLTLKKSQWQSSSDSGRWSLFAVYLIVFFTVLTYAQRKFYTIVSFVVMMIFFLLLPFFMLPGWTSLLLIFGAIIYFPFAGGGSWGGGGWDGGSCSGGGDGGGGGGGCGGGCGGCGGGG